MDLKRISIYRKMLMGIAACWIFLFHVWDPIFENVIFLKEIEWYIKETGYCGVDIFIFLSGWGLVYAIHKQKRVQFYVRRFLRVYPAFFIWFTASTLGRSDEMSLIDYLKRITFYANWTESLVACLWFIAAILMLYFWFPLYYHILKKQKSPVGFTVFLICMELLSTTVFYYNIRGDLFLFINRIPIFLLGVLIGHLCLESPECKIMRCQLNKVQWLYFGILGILLIAGSFYLHMQECVSWQATLKNILNMSMAIYICLGCSKLLECLEGVKIAQILKCFFGFMGTLSLEFYLTHELVSLKVKSYNLQLVQPEGINKMFIVGICFVTSLVGALILKKTVECGLKVCKYLTNRPQSHMLYK